MFVGYIYYYWTLSFPNDLIDEYYFPRTIGFFILPLSIGAIIPYVSSITINNWNRFHSRFVVKTSVLTYAIYLVHPFVYHKLLHLNGIVSYPIRFALALAFTYTLAFLTYYGFEKPILKFRDKITGYNNH